MKKPPNSGAKKGHTYKKSIMRVDEVLAEKNINPTEELLRLMPEFDLDQKLRAWGLILTYSQSKPVDKTIDDDTKNDISERLKDITDEQLIRAIEYKDKNGSDG